MNFKHLLSTVTIVLSLLSVNSCLIKQPDRFVEIEGKKQHIRVKGDGMPTVVFVTGLSTDLTNFDSVQNELSKITKTFSYDRVGIGKSEYFKNERSIDNLVIELNEILDKGGIDPPYLLVGHSFGGFIVRYFTKQHPEKVCGLLLIDPSSEKFEKEVRATKTENELREYDSIGEVTMAWTKDPKTLPVIRNEYHHFVTTDIELMKDVVMPNNIPITVLTSTRILDFMSEGYTKDDLDIWVNLHKSWSVDAPQMKHIVTDKSGHYIHNDEPDLVINELTSLIRQVKSNWR